MLFLSRRSVMVGAGASLTNLPMRRAKASVDDEIAGVEAGVGGRLGVCVIEVETGRTLRRRADERFPMCSTFKVLAAAALLRRVDAGLETLARMTPVRREDLVTYSPVTERKVNGPGMTLAQLCEAAITESDNTAGNLILDSLGGPSAVTAHARSLGDPVTRLDRNETSLNEATPGDPRDTTAPAAMAANLQRLVLGDALSVDSRHQLAAWMLACRTGAARLRAGLPPDWRIGDKTGSGDHGTTNDIAVVWPPEGSPLIVAAYLTDTNASPLERNAAIAQVGRIALRWSR